MRKIGHLFIYCSLFFLSIALKINAQSKVLSLEIYGLQETIDPGSHTQMVGKIINHSNQKMTADIRPILPENWSLLGNTFEKNLDFEPGQEKTLLLAFEVPQKSAAQDYQVGLSLSTNFGTEKKVKQISVNEIHDISVKNISKPEYIKRGDSITNQYLIKNNGNTEKRINISSNGKTNKQSFTIKPLEEQLVQVNYPEIDKKYNSNSYVTEFSIFPDNLTPIVKREVIPVYLSETRKVDPYNRFDTKFGVSHVFNARGESGWMYNFRTKGFLNEKKHRTLELVAQSGSRINRYAAFGNFERYYGRLDDRKTELIAGDYNYQSHLLIEQNRFGRGASLRREISKGLWVGGFYNNPRFNNNVNEIYGANIGYIKNLGNNTEVEFDVAIAKKDFENASENTATLAGFKTNLKLKGNLDIDLETAVSKEDAGNKGWDGWSGRARVNYHNERFSTNHQVIYADDKFRGFFNNSLLINSSLNIPIAKGLDAFGSYVHSETNVELDTINRRQAPITDGYSVGLNHRTKGNKINSRLYHFYRESRDQLELNNLAFNYETSQVRFYQRYALNENSNAHYELFYGRSANLLFNNNSRSEIYGLDLGYDKRIGQNFYFSLLGNYTNSNQYNRDNPSLQEFYTLGGRLTYNNHWINSYFSYRNRFNDDLAYQNRNFLEAGIDLIQNRHTFHSKVTYASLAGNADDDRDWFVLLGYTYNPQIGIGRKYKLSKIFGYTKDSHGNPLSDIMLALGEKTLITDEKGYFEFNGVEQGQYVLSLSKNNIESSQYVTNNYTPQRLAVGQGNEINSNLTLVIPSTLKGEVSINKEQETDFPDAVLILERGNDSVKTMMKKDGTFAFYDLRPGLYTLSGMGLNSNEKFEFNELPMQISIDEKQTQEIKLTLREVSRGIKMNNNKIEL